MSSFLRILKKIKDPVIAQNLLQHADDDSLHSFSQLINNIIFNKLGFTDRKIKNLRKNVFPDRILLRKLSNPNTNLTLKKRFILKLRSKTISNILEIIAYLR